MKEQTYTAAVIGLGRIGFTLGFDKKREQPASHTHALAANRRIKIIAGADTDTGKHGQWQKANPKAQVFSSSTELYASCSPDIIVIAVNEEHHLSEALLAIQKEPRLIILEKPVAVNVKEALEIQRLAQEHNVPILVNHERRFASDYRLAKSYLEQIGPLQSIHASLWSGLSVYSRERAKNASCSLLHDGTHLVDIVHFLLEPDTELLTEPRLGCLYKDTKGDVRNLSVNYTSPKCPDIQISISGRSRYFAFDIDIHGTEGRICIGNGYIKLYRRKESRLYTGFYSLAKDRDVKTPRKTGYFSNMVQNAADFLDGKAPLLSTLQTGINALTVLQNIESLIE